MVEERVCLWIGVAPGLAGRFAASSSSDSGGNVFRLLCRELR